MDNEKQLATGLYWYTDQYHDWELAHASGRGYSLLWSNENLFEPSEFYTIRHFLSVGEYWYFDPKIAQDIGNHHNMCPPCKIRILDIIGGLLRVVKYTRDSRHENVPLDLQIVMTNYRPLFEYKENLLNEQHEKIQYEKFRAKLTHMAQLTHMTRLKKLYSPIVDEYDSVKFIKS